MAKETPEIVDNTDLHIDEASAADTLKPGAGSGGTESKAETLATFTQLLSQLGKEDLSQLFNDVQSQYGPNNAPGAEDKSNANRSSIAMKSSAAVGKGPWKEDIDEIFASDDLTEDFKEKAAIVFEAALETRCILEETRLQEQYQDLVDELEEKFEQKIQEASSDMFEELSTKLDQYLDYVVEQWMEANELAIETQLRADIAEGFMEGLQNLFAEHYITVPENKLDIFAEMKAELDEIKSKLNESIDDKLTLQNIIDEATKEALLDEVSDGLAVTQSEKLRTLAEGLEYTNAETFKKKLEIVKENYFTDKKLSVKSGLITEEIDGTDEAVNESVIPASMSKYVETISKSIK